MSGAWERLLASVEKHRSYDARFYKPVCLIAAVDAVEAGEIAVSDIDPERIFARFDAYVRPIFPERAELGWRPFWHLSNDGAWHFSHEGRIVRPQDFGIERKPNSRRRLLSRADHIFVPPQARAAWRSSDDRRRLRAALIEMLLRDDDECLAVVERLRSTSDSGARGGRSEPVGLDAMAETSRSGQGFKTSSEDRLAIEQHAMGTATDLMEARGWRVRDVSRHESYDLHCTRQDGTCLYIEVKGTTGLGDQIQITPAEVAFAGAHHAAMMLIVVAGIQLVETNAGQPIAHGGRIEVHHPWAPRDVDLTPVSYLCRLRPGTRTDLPTAETPSS